MLIDQEINKIFSWQPYRDDWVVDRNKKTTTSARTMVTLLIINLTKNSSFDTYYSEDGGLGNYLEFHERSTVHPKVHHFGQELSYWLKVANFETAVAFYGAAVAFYSATVTNYKRPLPFMTHPKLTMTHL